MKVFDALGAWLKSLKPGSRLLIAAHVRPDGDAAGSAFGLASVLHEQKMNVSVVMPEGLPDNYEAFLDVSAYLIAPEAVRFEDFDWLICVDTSNPERVALGKGVVLPGHIPVAVIDHHADNKRYGSENFVAEASASAFVIYKGLEAAGFKLNPLAAEALLGGIIRDTGCFRFANTDAPTFEAACALMRAGADYDKLIQALYFMRPLKEVLAESELMLKCLTFADSDTIGFLDANPEVLNRYGFEIRNSDALIDQVRAIGCIEVVVLMIHLNPGLFKLSFRSKRKNRSVGAVARALGGGGHEMAASAVIEAENPEAARERVLKALC